MCYDFQNRTFWFYNIKLKCAHFPRFESYSVHVSSHYLRNDIETLQFCFLGHRIPFLEPFCGLNDASDTWVMLVYTVEYCSNKYLSPTFYHFEVNHKFLMNVKPTLPAMLLVMTFIQIPMRPPCGSYRRVMKSNPHDIYNLPWLREVHETSNQIPSLLSTPLYVVK